MNDPLVIGNADNARRAGAARLGRRAELIEKAAALRQDFLSTPHWRELAARHNIRLPDYYYPCEPKYMRRYMRKLGVSTAEYRDWFEEGLQAFRRNNPTWPLWAWVGLVLELVDERERLAQSQEEVPEVADAQY